ncbi:MAG: arsenite methyltransferase [Gemmatimonadota bacterium]|nr:arsenite methyltransferase [Gemmatimonadota bacterium]
MAKDAKDVKSAVRERYASAALEVLGGGSGCCGTAAHCDPVTRDIYEAGDTAGLPKGAVEGSLGCGNPTALADLSPGEIVLDLGSGGGIDVLLSARRVGPRGKAYGLDMTDEMLELARRNQRDAGVENVEFLRGEIEDIPLPDASVDVIISNCVINLSADKAQVFREAHRVLRPGGRFAVSDIVSRGPLGKVVRASLKLWSACVAGALEENDYRGQLEGAGFTNIEFEVTREFTVPGVGGFVSAFVRASKPA